MAMDRMRSRLPHSGQDRLHNLPGTHGGRYVGVWFHGRMERSEQRARLGAALQAISLRSLQKAGFRRFATQQQDQDR